MKPSARSLVRRSSLFSVVFTALWISCFSSTSFAFYSVHETGDLLKPGQMQMAAELQFITNRDDGIDLGGHFNMGLDEDKNLKFEAGTGTTDIYFGGYLKWVPFPDFEKQPAIGVDVGAHYANYEYKVHDNDNELTLRVIPFVSKKFTSAQGDFTPFASLPIGVGTYDDEGIEPVQIVFGSRYHHPDFEWCDFSAELGIKLHEAPTYFSIAAIFPAF